MTDSHASPLQPAEQTASARIRGMTDPGVKRADMHVEDAILSRRSIRAFRPDPVPTDLMRRILECARWAPSGSNIQPWKVHVLNGESRQRYTDALLAAERNGEPATMEYNYYAPEWREPFLGRRRACGFGLYAAMGVTRDDREGRKAAYLRNFEFFGAGTGLLFWIARDLEHGSWLDYGTFISSISLAARGWGLSTIAQGALGEFPHVAHNMFEVGDDHILIGGMSIGWPTEDAPVNNFQPDRLDTDDFTTWLD
ncbi:MAG: nitroreductase [Rhodospirillaceae bacterium]